MTAEEFAINVHVALADADEGGLSVEEQIEVLEWIAEEMKRADQ